MREIYIYNFSNTYGGQEKFIDYLQTEFKKNKIKLIVLKNKPGIRSFFKPINYPYKSGKSTKIIEILNGNYALFCRGFLIRKKNVKRIYIQHSSYRDHQEGLIKIIIRIILFYILFIGIEKIIRVSKSNLPKFFGSSKIKTIHNGVPSRNLSFIKKKNFNKKEIKFIMVGGINRNKNQDLAIKLLRKNKAYFLTILGDGALKNKLKKENYDLLREGRLNFKGIVKETKKYYLDADILLMLSFNEGLPFCVLEAMSYGLVVISSKVGGVPEIINDKFNGLLMEKNNIESLQKCVDYIISEDNLYLQLQKNSIDRFKNNLTSEIMAKKYINVIKDL
tara:strand:- start:621 stop:1622 length:1002 start_codon:yes stop_codon:yes gene_type:complete